MKKVCTAEQMRHFEKVAEDMGIIPLILMENAGVGFFNVLKNEVVLDNKKVVVVCGRGNNGGDGMVVARHLKNAKVSVSVIVVDDDKDFSTETGINFKILENLKVPIYKIVKVDRKIKEVVSDAEIIIDAIFGTGLKRNIEGVYKELILLINNSGKFVVSVDIPSGINSDNGMVMGCAVKANMTVSFGLYKLGHILFPGREYSGKVHVVDISLPEIGETRMQIITEEEKILLRKRHINSHKGTYGHMVVIGGSRGKTGAVGMCAKAGLKAGAGLVTVVCPLSLNDIVESSNLEVMTYPVYDNEGFMDKRAVKNLKDFLFDKDSVVLGPGLGFNEITMDFVKDIFKDINSPTVIDADGLNCISQCKNILKEKRNSELILTPHPGEMARLVGKSTLEILKNPIDLVVNFAKEYSIHLILKGATTIYSNPKGEIYFSTLGNPGMATAGSGDVLSGIIGSFLAQKYDTKEAIILALLIHGMAGDFAKAAKGEYALNASDIINSMPEVLKKLEG